ncbi:MAG: ABC transporter permease [Fluviicola sp.]|jgi:ABC-2 type transport system permease protein
MRQTFLIASRELRERIFSRSFILMGLIGPIIVLISVYLLFKLGGKDQQKWNVLVADPRGVFAEKIVSAEDPTIDYDFANDYITPENFVQDPRFKEYDALVEINEKVITNKVAYLFYKEKPSFSMSVNIRYHVERRLEEVLAVEHARMTLADFRKIKQPLNFGFRNAYDPENKQSDNSAWVGLAFGTLIVLFIFLFGNSILRSVSSEKSNRIVEVLMSSVSSQKLLLGKIVGIGLSAFIQLLIWIGIIGIGLYWMRSSIFMDIYDPTVAMQTQGATDYNEFVELVFEQIQFASMLFYGFLFLLAGYLFYGAFFAGIGASMGSESDGQQFLIPLILLLFLSIYAGYYYMEHPSSALSTFFHYFPFTSPVVVMVRLAQGYPPGEGIYLFVSLFLLIMSAVLTLFLAARLYKNGLLQFGHSVRLKSLIQWIKMK